MCSPYGAITPVRTPDHNSLQLEESGGVCKNPAKESWKIVLLLAYQSLGVVYGDLGISPLYVLTNIFAEDIKHTDTNEEIFGVLSFVFWTLTLVPLLKYVFIVLRADDNGEGGTFALYSLLCRHAKVCLTPNCQLADKEISGYKKDHTGVPNTKMGMHLRSMLEKHRLLQKMLLILALVGASMVIGDGVLTPALSVFSAVSGLELLMPKEHLQHVRLPIACIILVCVFSLQHYGTHRLGFLFAPIIIIWLLCIGMIGVYNIFLWNPNIYQALSPRHMYSFLKKSPKGGWLSLGGILLCITGSEAMFADLGHFSQLSIKIAFTFVVYPSLVLAYMGQAAYLSKNHYNENNYQIGLYLSVPEQLRVPFLAVAILAVVVGTQATITGTFSIIKHCSALGCFPRVKVVHTSPNIHGQIYIPEINWLLMLLCLATTIGFRDIKNLGNASGLAIITVMLVTTCLMSLVIVLCWHQSIFLAICFILIFGSIEVLFFSASLFKIREGAWVPIVISFLLMVTMYVWHYGTLKKYEFDVQNKVPIDWLLTLGPSLGIVRVRGIGLVYTELVSGIPVIFSHFVTNLLAFHQVVVFICIKSVPLPCVLPEERFLISRVGPKMHRMYRCIVRYGYIDVQNDDIEFESDLVYSIAEFIRKEVPGPEPEPTGREEDLESENQNMTLVDEATNTAGSSERREIKCRLGLRKSVSFVLPKSPQIDMGMHEELQELMEARELGMSLIIGHSYLRASHQSSLIKKLAINYGYEFLRRNSRGTTSIARVSTMEVGMCYLV